MKRYVLYMLLLILVADLAEAEKLTAISSINILLTETNISASLNDMCWGAFFASGDLRYVDKIISHLKYLNERRDINLYLTAAMAQWSLSSNARQHPLVKLTIENIISSNDSTLSDVAVAILRKKPKQILYEMYAVLKEQKEKGVWIENEPQSYY